METLYKNIIDTNSDLILVVVLALFFTLEHFFDKPNPFKKRTKHLLHGVVLQVGFIIVNLAFASVFVLCFNWIEKYQIGIFNRITIPYSMKIIIGILGIDFVSYWTHLWYHKFGLFWRLHRVHHSDIEMDSSTVFRFHPFDALLGTGTIILAGAIFGLDMNIAIFQWIMYIPFFIIQHSSMSFPKWTDKVFGNVFVTPNFHKVHHHRDQKYTDSNYGNMFIFWDKLFGTFKTLPVSEIKFGLKEFDTKERQTFWYLLKSPFLNIKKIDK